MTSPVPVLDLKRQVKAKQDPALELAASNAARGQGDEAPPGYYWTRDLSSGRKMLMKYAEPEPIAPPLRITTPVGEKPPRVPEPGERVLYGVLNQAEHNQTTVYGAIVSRQLANGLLLLLVGMDEGPLVIRDVPYAPEPAPLCWSFPKQPKA
jgi:hypothetical protein